MNDLHLPDWARDVHAPNHAVSEIEPLVREQFGIEGEYRALAGEREQNFAVRTNTPQQWVVKISHGAEAQYSATYQSALLSHLQQRAPGLAVPRNRPSVTGAPYVVHRFDDGQRATVRVVSYLEGIPSSSLPGIPQGWAGAVGAFQGKLCVAFRGFEHTSATRFMPWDASSDVMLDGDMLAFLGPEFGARVAPHLERLTRSSLPALRAAPAQVIHNDLHPGNVLLDDEGNIAGLIDFGDAICRPLVQDLAVTAASLIEVAPAHAEQQVPELIDGFVAECPLSEASMGLLYDAILLRSILSVALGRMKDQLLAPGQRPRPATRLSEAGLHKVLDLKADFWRDARQKQEFTDG